MSQCDRFSSSLQLAHQFVHHSPNAVNNPGSLEHERVLTLRAHRTRQGHDAVLHADVDGRIIDVRIEHERGSHSALDLHVRFRRKDGKGEGTALPADAGVRWRILLGLGHAFPPMRFAHGASSYRCSITDCDVTADKYGRGAEAM